MKSNSNQAIFYNQNDTLYNQKPKEPKLANSVLAHLSVDSSAIASLNGYKMEEAMSGLRSITHSLKEILNRNLKASNENILSKPTAVLN